MRSHSTPLALVAAFLAVGCSSNTDDTGSAHDTGSADNTGNAGGTAAGVSKEPPARDEGAVVGDGPGVVLAIQKLYLGDTDPRTGAMSEHAWKQLGYDLDGKTSSATSLGLCKPADGGTAKLSEDGDGGTDNSFGRNIYSLFTALMTDASTQVNDRLGRGGFTLVLDLAKLGTGDAYRDLDVGLYVAAPLTSEAGEAVEPKWDGTDVRSVAPEHLSGGDISRPKVRFSNSYVVKDAATGIRTWVSGPKGTITFPLDVGWFTMNLTLHAAVITLELSADNQHAARGTISGVVPTEQFVSEVSRGAGSFDPSLCPGTAMVDSFATLIRQASDIGSDGSQDPDKTCDGISFAVGFDMAAVTLGEVAAAAPPAESPCE